MLRYERRASLNHAEVLIEAFELHHHEIPQLFKPAVRPEVPALPVDGRLFPPRAPRAETVQSEGTVQINFTLRPVERDIVDTLVDGHDVVPDRNALIVAMLTAHLDVVEPARDSDFAPRQPGEDDE